MRFVPPRVVLVAIWLCATPGRAEDRSFHEIAPELGLDLDGSNEPPAGPFLRPLDDSDGASRAQVQRFFDATPCGNAQVTGGVCHEALEILRGGGGRLARYLIRQVEANAAEGFPNQATYMRLLGYTENPVAVDYLRNEVAIRRKAFEREGEAARDPYLIAIEALGRTRSREAADVALAILEASEDPQVQLHAVNAFDRAQARHGPLPEGAARLAAVREANAERARAAAGPDLPERLVVRASPWREAQRRIEKVLRDPGHTW